MDMIHIRFKKLSDKAKTPLQASKGAAGFDLYASRKTYNTLSQCVYHTDVAFEIPKGYVGLMFPRSSVSKTDLRLSNSAGVIDSDYRGEVSFVFDEKDVDVPLLVHGEDIPDSFTNNTKTLYYVGDRIGQIVFVPIPQVDLIESDTLSETERGAGGYGSTGR